MKIKVGHINTLGLFAIIIMNIISLITRDGNIYDYLFYVSPFILIFALYIIFNNSKHMLKINAFIFACFGLFATISGEQGNGTGIIFLCFSLYIYNSQRSNIILISLVLLSFIIKYIISGIDTIQLVILFSLYLYSLTIYYLLIHPKKTEMIKDPKISEQNRKIIQYLVAGKQYKEIAEMGDIWLSSDAMRQRITRVRRDFDCFTDNQLIYKLLKQGYFK